jgi:uncharacterized iron-regulated protein
MVLAFSSDEAFFTGRVAPLTARPEGRGLGHNGVVIVSFVLAALQSDFLTLEIRSSRAVEVRPGYTDLRSGRSASAADVAAAAEGVRYVLLGETHDSPDHHRMQAEVIQALVARGRNVVVGLEMFTRPRQRDLNAWTLGWSDEARFIEESGWKTEWGYDFALYRPVFETIRAHRLRMVALNVPRDWVRAVGRGGPDALPEEARGQVPRPDRILPEHRRVFESMIGGHPLQGQRGDNMIAAQTLWDEGMADTAIKYFAANPGNPRTVMVILAGSGHVVHGAGINARLRMRAQAESVSVVGVDSDGPRLVNAGVADFVYLSAPPPRPPRPSG